MAAASNVRPVPGAPRISSVREVLWGSTLDKTRFTEARQNLYQQASADAVKIAIDGRDATWPRRRGGGGRIAKMRAKPARVYDNEGLSWGTRPIILALFEEQDFPMGREDELEPWNGAGPFVCLRVERAAARPEAPRELNVWATVVHPETNLPESNYGMGIASQVRRRLFSAARKWRFEFDSLATRDAHCRFLQSSSRAAPRPLPPLARPPLAPVATRAEFPSTRAQETLNELACPPGRFEMWLSHLQEEELLSLLLVGATLSSEAAANRAPGLDALRELPLEALMQAPLLALVVRMMWNLVAWVIRPFILCMCTDMSVKLGLGVLARLGIRPPGRYPSKEFRSALYVSTCLATAALAAAILCTQEYRDNPDVLASFLQSCMWLSLMVTLVLGLRSGETRCGFVFGRESLCLVFNAVFVTDGRFALLGASSVATRCPPLAPVALATCALVAYALHDPHTRFHCLNALATATLDPARLAAFHRSERFDPLGGGDGSLAAHLARRLRTELGWIRFGEQAEERRGGAPGDSCVICLGDLLGSERSARVKQSCDHVFHARCLEEWFDTCGGNSKQRTCPVCRAQLWSRLF